MFWPARQAANQVQFSSTVPTSRVFQVRNCKTSFCGYKSTVLFRYPIAETAGSGSHAGAKQTAPCLHSAVGSYPTATCTVY